MRVSPKQIRLAHAASPHLARMLRACGGLEHAQREWQWIKNELPKHEWAQAAYRRSLYEPLQYILGTQPFGTVEVKCRSGVLIPRWETEEWTMKLAVLIEENLPRASIIDGCTGTGCVALLLKSMVPQSSVLAFDLSPSALSLAEENCNESGVTVFKHDVFTPLDRPADILVANPPYIPQIDMERSQFHQGLERLVREWEPRMALEGDTEFYEALITNIVEPLKALAFVFEVGYKHQCDFVRQRLPQWKVVDYYDSADRIRCVVGYLPQSSWLEALTTSS